MIHVTCVRKDLLILILGYIDKSNIQLGDSSYHNIEPLSLDKVPTLCKKYNISKDKPILT